MADDNEVLDPDFNEMCNALIALMVNYGIIGVVLRTDEQYPDHVREAYADRVAAITQRANEETSQIQAFGEAFDADPQ